MAPFRWPDTKHDLALAIEVAICKPAKPQDWEIIATKLSNIFSTEDRPVEVRGRGCRERMDRLLDKFRTEDARSLKRSGTEEEYGELNQLLEDISSYRRDDAAMKISEKESKKKKQEDEKKQAVMMRMAAMEGLAKRKNSGTSSSSEDKSSNDEEDSISAKKDGKKKMKKRFSRISAVEMLNEKNSKRAELKEKELNIRKLELEFQQKKFEVEAEERKQKLQIELEERKTMVELLKKKL